MKAAVYTQYGGPEVLYILDVPKPVPAKNQILIQVFASSVNRTDCGFLRASPFIVRFFAGLFKPKNTILGNEFAGKVAAVGEQVTSFQVGDKVFGYSGSKFGGHAQFMVMPEAGSVGPMPKNLTYEQAAPSNEGSHYALNLIRSAKIKAGQKILINGTTGAIGSAAVQLVHHIGAHITAVCDTKNIDLVKSLGADSIIDYTTTDFTTIPAQYDVIIDAVGNSSFGKCKKLMSEYGIYVSTELGPWAQNPLFGLLSPFFPKKKVLFPIPFDNKKDVLYFKELIETGKFRPVLDKSYPLEEIADAFRYVEKGHKTGNVVILIPQDESED